MADAVAGGRLLLVLAGSCDVSKGVLSGFDHHRCGVVWVDAHGDFNTPESTASGFFARMSLAVITCHPGISGPRSATTPRSRIIDLLADGIRPGAARE